MTSTKHDTPDSHFIEKAGVGLYQFIGTTRYHIVANGDNLVIRVVDSDAGSVDGLLVEAHSSNVLELSPRIHRYAEEDTSVDPLINALEKVIRGNQMIAPRLGEPTTDGPLARVAREALRKYRGEAASDQPPVPTMPEEPEPKNENNPLKPVQKEVRWWYPHYSEEGLQGFASEEDRDAYAAGGPGPFRRVVARPGERTIEQRPTSGLRLQREAEEAPGFKVLRAEIQRTWKHAWWGMMDCDRCPYGRGQKGGPCDACPRWPHFIKDYLDGRLT